ncbi:hypothetical protein BH23PLA1_BH23PLA1_34370 [soil metagenome]
MGNFRQHVGLASFLGLFYAWGAYVIIGLHWLYGSVAALLATLAGLLPDLDSESSVQLRGFTGILGVLAAVAVWRTITIAAPTLPFEVQLWAIIIGFVAVRHGLRRTLARLTVHRGMNHSIPTALSWGALTYLLYPSPYHSIRVMMAAAVLLGVFSHLILDELSSVDLRGARVNKAFGTALKLWSRSPWATLVAYALLAYLTWQLLEVWPETSFSLDELAPRDDR